ncbi:MAG: hypothetical protein QXY18_01005 [Nitrososphaerota archaeon]
MNLRELNVEPGVYVEYKPTTVLPSGFSLNILALIGRSSTTKKEIENIKRKDNFINGNGDSRDNLSYPIVPNYIVETITASDSKVYKRNIDFVVSSNVIDWNTSFGKASLVTNVSDWSQLSSKSIVIEINLTPYIINFSTVGNVDDALITFQDALSGVATVTKIGSPEQIKITVLEEINFGSFISSKIKIVDGNGASICGWYIGEEIYGASRPAKDIVFTISYERAKVYPNDYEPIYYFNYSDILSDHGDINLEDPTKSSLSLGAKIAFENGAAVVLCVPMNPHLNDYVATREALQKLQNYNVSYLVVLSNNIDLIPLIKDHVNRMSTVTERKFRKAMIGLPQKPIFDLANLARSLNDMRITLVYPYEAFRYEGNVSLKLNSSYIACELAAKRCATSIPSISLLRNVLTSFYDITDTLTREEKNMLAFSGITIIEKIPNLNVCRVRDWLTSSSDSIHRNGEIVDIIDYVSIRAMNLVDNSFIGKPFTDEMLLTIKAFLTNFLDSLVLNGILNGYSEVEVKKSSVEPTQCDVSFKIIPIYTLKYVYIRFTI